MASGVLESPIRTAVAGYGGAYLNGKRVGFAAGRSHAEWIVGHPEFELAALCDTDAARLGAAGEDFPEAALYQNVNGLLADGGVDVVVVATPHNTHAALTLAALEAGAHVIVEKPMCITVAEADAMIACAHSADRMLSVFHNRRWDGDFMAIREVIAKGLLGDVFHVESGSWTYTHPIKTWGAWRADKAISGGAFYDIGAHHLDWVLNLVPGAVVGVFGTTQNRVWHDVTNEDHVGAFLRFSSGAVADVHISHIAHAGRPKWRILGTKGAIVDDRSDERSFKVMTRLEGYPAKITVPYMERTWEAYYQTIADHLLRGAPLAVTPESARRVIAVIEATERSAKSGRTESVPHES